MRKTSTQKCEFCDKIRAEFSKASHFKRHAASHQKKLCKECGKLFGGQELEQAGERRHNQLNIIEKRLDFTTVQSGFF